MKNIFRRRKAAPLPPVRNGMEREIAIGSLSGVAPADIRAHLLLAATPEGISVTGNGCPVVINLILARAALSLAEQALAGHECGGGHQ